MHTKKVSRKKNRSFKNKKGSYKQKIKRGRKHTRKYRHKGGAIYGTGYGANCYDPNFSIYNTRELQLFPYSPK